MIDSTSVAALLTAPVGDPMRRRHFLLVLLCAVLAVWTSACAAPGVIHEEMSPYGPIIVTEDASGMRTLLFAKGGARQSVAMPGDPDRLELAYTRAALAGLALCDEPRRMLVVGLGGGTLPIFLHRHYPGAAIDVVDINPRVLAVATRYFGFTEDERLRAYISDGREFIEKQQPSTYDAIFLDAFGATDVPRHLTTREFLLAVRRATVPSGVVIGNVWRRGSNPLYDAMLETYREVFGSLFVLDVAGDVNAMFLALPRQRAVTEAQLARAARDISARQRFGFDLGSLVTGRFHDASGKSGNAQVLRDSR